MNNISLSVDVKGCLDCSGHMRMIWGFRSANGPTMRDGPKPLSVLGGNGRYAERLRVVRRL